MVVVKDELSVLGTALKTDERVAAVKAQENLSLAQSEARYAGMRKVVHHTLSHRHYTEQHCSVWRNSRICAAITEALRRGISDLAGLTAKVAFVVVQVPCGVGTTGTLEERFCTIR